MIFVCCVQSQAQRPSPYEDTNRFNGSEKPALAKNIVVKMMIQWPNDIVSLGEVEVEFDQLGWFTNQIKAEDTNHMNIGEPLGNDVAKDSSRRLIENDWLFYLPTNGFGGPLELQNAQGQKIASLRAKGSAPEDYPISFSFREAESNFMSKFMFYSGPAFPIGIQNQGIITAPFKLANFFALTNGVEYKLTLWPMLYTRVPTNRYLCVRVELEPVTVKFKCPGEIPK